MPCKETAEAIWCLWTGLFEAGLTCQHLGDQSSAEQSYTIVVWSCQHLSMQPTGGDHVFQTFLVNLWDHDNPPPHTHKEFAETISLLCYNKQKHCMSTWMPGGYAFEGVSNAEVARKHSSIRELQGAWESFCRVIGALQSNLFWHHAPPHLRACEVLAVVLKFCPTSSIDSLP